MNNNILLQTDSYKAGHAGLYPEDVTGLYAYFESRGGLYPQTVFFGLQYYLQEYLEGVRVTRALIREAESFWKAHFGRDDYFDASRWERLLDAHGGKLPLRIKAVPEGTLVPTNNVLFTVENTDDEFPWLVGWVETLLMKVWYPTVIATQSYYLKRQIRQRRRWWSDDENGLDFMVHDFGYRGCTSEEQAAIGGAAHLTSFKGTDTVAGILLLRDHYSFDPANDMYGFSVPATEHSIILAHKTERDAFEHVLNRYPTGIVACVSDTNDIFKAVNDLWGTELRDKVTARDGVLVVRPDSGEPTEVVLRVLDGLAQRFGYTLNKQDKKVIDSHVRVIQGDGMTPTTILDLYDFIGEAGYAPENLTVGSGGGMLQAVNRDTQRFAYKISSVRTRDGKERAVSKHPVTDNGKASKAGRFLLVRDLGQYRTYVDDGGVENGGYLRTFDTLQTVFENGYVQKEYSIENIRDRLAART